MRQAPIFLRFQAENKFCITVFRGLTLMLKK